MISLLGRVVDVESSKALSFRWEVSPDARLPLIETIQTRRVLEPEAQDSDLRSMALRCQPGRIHTHGGYDVSNVNSSVCGLDNLNFVRGKFTFLVWSRCSNFQRNSSWTYVGRSHKLKSQLLAKAVAQPRPLS